MARTALSVLVLLATVAAAVAAESKPLDWLKSQTPPAFAPGSTLPPLTRWGWSMSFEVAKELADRWGYAVEFADYVSEKVADEALANPDGRNGRCLALVAGDPKRYKLGILLDRQFPKDMPPEAYLRDAQGQFISDKGNPKMLSPEMPADCLKQAGQLSAVGLAKLHTRCPIAIIQNGGEYGLNVIGWSKPYWEKDPKVVAAKGGLSWYQYISRRKAREQKAVADAVRAATPDRLLYVHYTCGGDTHRHGTLETFHDDWAWDYADMRACADTATNEYYYHDFNSGWIGKDDMLTQALGAKGYELRFGMKNSYDYLCPGYKQDEKAPAAPVWDAAGPIDNDAKAFGDLRLYEGFLKCLYTEGMIGGVAGYFSYPKGGFDAAFSPDKPPQCLMQMVILARVHALFSHQEAFLRQGDLLPGPNKHAKVTDQPAYEFPTGVATRRVLARKMPNQAKWLITAWASDGVEGPATVEVPELGSVTLQARAIGSVYAATLQDGRSVLKQVDAARAEPSTMNTDWFKDSRYGVFMHFLPADAKGSALMGDFDVEALAGQLGALGAKHFVITLGQNSGYFISPNAAYDRRTGYAPGERCAKRDLPLDLYKALRPKGIRLMLYLPCQTPNQDRRAQKAFGLPEGPKDQPIDVKFAGKWAEVIQEWSDRYQDKVAGWWFDGGYDHIHFSEAIAQVYAKAAKHGNPNAIVTFNPGVKVVRHTKVEDYTAGELNEPLGVVPAARRLDGSQWHALTYLGSTWGQRGTRFPAEKWAAWVKAVVAREGVVTLDMGPNWDSAQGSIGSLAEEQVKQVKAIRAALE